MASPDRTLLTESDVTGPGPLRDALNAKASLNHKSRHAAGGPDAITPESIGALENRANTIADGVNLNDLVTPGNYYRYALVGATAELNYPGGNAWAGWITVIGTTVGNILQVAYSARPESVAGGRYDHIDNTWYRARNGVTWGAWSRLNSGPIEGAGSPQGVVRAPAGTEYIDTSGTNGAWKWIKKTAISTTGWVVTEGDTGWREMPVDTWISSVAFPVVSKQRLRRVGDTVWVGLEFEYEAAQFSYRPSATPAGFRPDLSAFSAPMAGYSGEPIQIGVFGVNSSGTTFMRTRAGIASATTGYFTTSWTTSQAWPTTLPGTPA